MVGVWLFSQATETLVCALTSSLPAGDELIFDATTYELKSKYQPTVPPTLAPSPVEFSVSHAAQTHPFSTGMVEAVEVALAGSARALLALACRHDLAACAPGLKVLTQSNMNLLHTPFASHDSRQKYKRRTQCCQQFSSSCAY